MVDETKKNSDDTERVFAYIPPELKHRLKLFTVRRDVTITSTVIAALREYMDKREQGEGDKGVYKSRGKDQPKQ